MRNIALLTLVTLGVQILSPLFQNTFANNATYYIDATGGNDINDGLSSGTGAWQTIARVNSGGFLPGDQILFKCGEGWNESLIIQDSGINGSPITFGSYGTCNGSNKPVLTVTGATQVTESGSQSYLQIDGLSFSGDIAGQLVQFSGNGTGVSIMNTNFSNPTGSCVQFSQTNNINVVGNTFSNCQDGVDLGNMTATATGNTFSNMGTGKAITMSLSSSGTRNIANNTFSNLGGNAITFGGNANITHNVLTNICTNLNSCAAIKNAALTVQTNLNSIISGNFITNVGTGISFSNYHLDGILLDTMSQGVTIDANTISNAQSAITIVDGNTHTVSNNTIYNPRTYGVRMEQSGIGAVYSNSINNNTILTYNPDYSMVRIENKVDNATNLTNFSGNTFLNVYKPTLPIVEVLAQGGNSLAVDKNSLALVDTGASNFTYFGYKTYTSTGSYSGANLIANGAFSSNIAGWTTDVLSLSYDASGNTLHAAQGVNTIGTLSSNTFSVTNGALYEVSGTIKNITNTEGHDVKVRLTNSVNTLYGDREFDVIATATGSTFKAYVKANTDAVDAQLDFILSSPNNNAEFDNIVVRQVVGLTYNARTNEAVLVFNTGATANSFSCSWGGCPNYGYADPTKNNGTVTFPLSISGYTSQILFWRDMASSFTPLTILHRPKIASFLPSNGAPGNGVPVTLSWSGITNSISNTLTYITHTGTFITPISTSGSIDIIPPFSVPSTNTITSINDIGTTTITADISPTNSPPVAISTYYATGSEGDVSISGAVTGTDPNMPYDSLTYALQSAPVDANKSITSFDNPTGQFDINYSTINPNFCGTDQFDFSVTDGGGLNSIGIAYITVNCVNDAPVAIDDAFSGTGGILQSLNVLANDTDVDSPYVPQTFSLSGFTQPANGTVSINGTQFDYTPNPAFYGTDSFTYTMEDQSGALSNTGTVTITVAPGTNFPPVVSGNSYNLNEDTLISDVLSGSDLNNDILTFSASVLPSHGVLSIVGSGFTYTPDANYYGSDSFTFIANDGQVNSSGATIGFTINPVADAPIAVNDTIGVQMSTLSNLNVLVNDIDPDNLTPTPANQGLTITGYTLPSHGTLNLIGNQFQYTSYSAYTGSDSFDYIVEDPTGLISNTGTVNINVSSTNQVPVADSGAFTTAEDTLLINTLSGSDPEAAPVSFVVDTNVTHGTLNLSSTGGFTYMPNLNYNGPDSFTFHVSDGVWNSAIQTVTIDITPVNDIPVAVNDTESGTEDATSTFYPLVNDYDVDVGDVIHVSSITNQPSHGTAVLSGTTEIIYTPVANYCGPDSLLYQDMDLSGAVSGGATMTINVACVNDAPTVTDSSYSVSGNIPTSSGNTLVGTLTGADIDGPSLTYILGTGASNGALSVSSTGGFSYAPNLGFSGSDTFTYTITDGSLTSSSATVTITVNPNNLNLPPIANNDTLFVTEDTFLTSSLSGTDPESAPLTFLLDTGATHGTLTLSSTGVFNYTPSLNYNGPDSFIFHVNDGVNDSSGATVALTVTPVNDAPVANNDTVVGTEDTVSLVTPLTNDTDVDTGDTISLAGFTQGTHGTVSASGTTMIVYTPTANYCGTDSVTYSAQDLSGAVSNTGTITINLTCVNDIPVAINDTTATGTEDMAMTIPVLANDTDVEDGIPTNIANLTQPSTGGTVGIVGTNIVFSPTTNYCGATPITFTYQARDSASALSNVATVTIPAITCVNDAPVTQSASYTMTGNVVISSGTILSGGTLTGFLATNNILAGIISASDVENNPLTFTLATLPATGTASVSSTGIFDYIPANDFVGSITFDVTTNDGLASSAPATISICVISPNASVGRPACAPTLPGVITTPVVNAGPGGGGGGGGGSSSPAASFIAATYKNVMTNAVSSNLTSQLYLTHQNLSESNSGSTEIVSGVSTAIAAPINTLLRTITNIVDTTNLTGLSDRGGAPAIRSTGRSILTKILSTESLTKEEQVANIEATTTQFGELLMTSTTARESLTLKHLIRTFYAKRAKILAEIQILKNLLIQQ